jgi:RHS repeat-associated protein
MSSKFTRKHGLVLLGLLAVTGGAMMMKHSKVHPFAGISGTIGSGQTVSGTISGTNTDTYSFTPNVSDAIQVSLGTDGTTGFEAKVVVANSAGTQKATCTTGVSGTNPFHCEAHVLPASVTTGGTWTAKITKALGTSGGYSLNLLDIPGATSVSNGLTGGIMYASTTYSGSINRGDMDIWTAEVQANTTATFTLTATGGTGFTPIVWTWEPDGTSLGGTSTSTSTTFNYGGTGRPGGTYTFSVVKSSGNDGAGTYTLSLSGSGAILPILAKSDTSCAGSGANPTVIDYIMGQKGGPQIKGGILPADDEPQIAYTAAGVTDYANPVFVPQSDASGQSFRGDPINVATGNTCETVVDYTTSGQNPLSLVRTYHSLSYARGLYPTLTGVNWRTNYDRYLRIISYTQIAAERPDGQVINFRCNVSTKSCVSDSDEDYTLTYSGSHGATWKLTTPDDTVETYSNTSGKGTLSSIALRNGYTQTMNYTAGVLTSVSDSYSRSLSFTYTGGVITGVTTPDSATLTYGYTTTSGQSLLTSVSYNTSPTTKITYLYENSVLPFMLTGITDENGNRYATWAYDGQGRGTSAKLGDTLGADLTQIAYSSTGNVVTGPLGIADTYKTTKMQNLQKTTTISRAANGTVASATESIRYDSNGFRNSLTDWNGNNTSWTNNSNGLPSAVTFASSTTNAQTTNITYDLTWPHLPHTLSTNGLNANFTYDSSGNMLTRKLTDTTSQSVPYSTNGTTRTWTYTYNGTGQLLTAQLPRTDVTAKTTYAYTSGTLTSITDALSHVTTITNAQGGGLPTKIKDPNGILTTLAYNNRNWMTSSVIATSAGNLTTSYAYDSAGNLTKATLPDNSYLSYAYDNAHRLTTVTNALSETQNLTLDAMGNVTQTLWKDASSNTKYKHTATFDALGRMLTNVDGQGNSTSFTYDKNSNTLTITDPLNHVTTQTFDSLDRLSTYKNAENDSSSIQYDSHSRPLTVKDGKGNSTTYVYDGFGDTILQNSPDSLKTILYYDGDANVTGVNQSGINYSSVTYDKLDRLTTRTYSGDSTLNVSILYDSSGHGFGVGHMTSLTDKVGSLSRNYDERGNITSDARTINSNTWTSSYTYDSAGRLSSITYASSGWVIGYGRDSAGQIQYVSATQPGHAAVNLAKNITHMPFGPASTWSYGNGVTDTRTFDKAYRMSGVRDTGAGDIQYLSYGYDAADNVTSITDNVSAANDQTLTYDRIDRLKSATGVYGTVSSITYDSNSNRKTYGASTYTTPGLNDRMSNAAGSAITYTSTGNVNGIGTDSMTYNQANQMATATVSGTTSSYFYDAFGQRLKLKTPGTKYAVDIYNLDGSMQSETNSGTETDYAYFDGIPLSAIQPGAATISALHTDNIATIQRATNAAKTIVWTGNYEPFGAVTPTTTITQNQRFLNNYADNTGYYHNGFRDRNPSSTIGAGRYLQVDPLGLGAGLNPYVYLGNNPFKLIDPWGLAEHSVLLNGNNSQELRTWAQSYQPGNFNTIIVHGTEQGGFSASSFAGDEQIDPITAADKFKDNPDYDPNLPTRVLACEAAATGAAQSFATELQTTQPVYSTSKNITYPVYTTSKQVALGHEPVTTSGGTVKWTDVNPSTKPSSETGPGSVYEGTGGLY